MIKNSKSIEEQETIINDLGTSIKGSLNKIMEDLIKYYRGNAEENGMSYNALLKVHNMIDSALNVFTEIDARVNKNITDKKTALTLPRRTKIPRRTIKED